MWTCQPHIKPDEQSSKRAFESEILWSLKWEIVLEHQQTVERPRKGTPSWCATAWCTSTNCELKILILIPSLFSFCRDWSLRLTFLWESEFAVIIKSQTKNRSVSDGVVARASSDGRLTCKPHNYNRGKQWNCLCCTTGVAAICYSQKMIVWRYYHISHTARRQEGDCLPYTVKPLWGGHPLGHSLVSA